MLSLAVIVSMGGLFQEADVHAAAGGTIKVRKTVTLMTGKGYQLHPRAKHSIDKKGYLYKSSSPKVAVVTPGGKINAVRKGTAWITVTSRASSSVRTKVKVKVNKKKSNIVTMEVGSAAKMKLNTANAANTSAVWTSSDPAAASVDKRGIVIAKGNGNAVITASSKKLAGGRQTFRIMAARKVTTLAELQSALSGSGSNILAANDISVTSDITVPADKTVLLGRGTKLTANGGIITNKGRITNITAATYVCRPGTASKMTASACAKDDSAANQGTAQDPDAEAAQEAEADAVIADSQQLNPGGDEAGIDVTEDKGLDLKMESYIEVSDYSDFLSNDGILLAPNATVIVGGQRIFGSAQDGAKITLSAFTGRENDPAAYICINGDGEITVFIRQEAAVNTTAKYALGAMNINVGEPYAGESGMPNKITLASLDAVAPNTNIFINGTASCYVGQTELYGPDGDNAVFTALDHKPAHAEDSFIGIERTDPNETYLDKPMGYIRLILCGVNVNKYYPAALLISKDVTFKCKKSLWDPDMIFQGNSGNGGSGDASAEE